MMTGERQGGYVDMMQLSGADRIMVAEPVPVGSENNTIVAEVVPYVEEENRPVQALSPAELFDALDTNHDGVLTEAELSQGAPQVVVPSIITPTTRAQISISPVSPPTGMRAAPNPATPISPSSSAAIASSTAPAIVMRMPSTQQVRTVVSSRGHPVFAPVSPTTAVVRQAGSVSGSIPGSVVMQGGVYMQGPQQTVGMMPSGRTVQQGGVAEGAVQPGTVQTTVLQQPPVQTMLQPPPVQTTVVQPTMMHSTTGQPTMVQSTTVQPTAVQPATVQPTVVQATAAQPTMMQIAGVQPTVAQSTITTASAFDGLDRNLDASLTRQEFPRVPSQVPSQPVSPSAAGIMTGPRSPGPLSPTSPGSPSTLVGGIPQRTVWVRSPTRGPSVGSPVPVMQTAPTTTTLVQGLPQIQALPQVQPLPQVQSLPQANPTTVIQPGMTMLQGSGSSGIAHSMLVGGQTLQGSQAMQSVAAQESATQMQAQTAANLFDALDRNHDGSLNRAELNQAMQAMRARQG